MIKHTYQEYNNREERNKFIANKLLVCKGVV